MMRHIPKAGLPCSGNFLENDFFPGQGNSFQSSKLGKNQASENYIFYKLRAVYI